MRLLSGHRRMVNSVSFSPDGRMLLSTGGYATEEARLFDLTTGKAKWAFYEQVETRFWGAALTPEGTRLLTSTYPGGCRFVDLDSLAETPLPLQEGAPRPIGNPIFSPDGTQMIARADLWETGPRLHWWAYPTWEPLPTWTVAMQWAFRYCPPLFSPDSRTLADVAGREVILYDVATGGERRRLPVAVKDGKAAMAFSPDSRLLAVASGLALVVWDVTTGAEVVAFRQKRKYFLGAAFTHDGRYLGTVSNEETVKLWDTSGWRLAREYAWQIGGLKSLAFSPDGMLAAAGGDKKKIVVWDLDD